MILPRFSIALPVLALAAFGLGLSGSLSLAQDGPLRIEITEGVERPMPVALRVEEQDGGEEVEAMAAQIGDVIAADLEGTGIFEIADPDGVPESRFDQLIDYVGWKANEVEALVTASVAANADSVSVRFRLFDIFAGQPLGDGMQFDAPREGWRRAAHKIADQIYARITGEAPYFDSRIAFVGESGPATERIKQVGVMDYDGEGVKWLTSPGDLVLSPRFSPDGRTLLYTSFGSGLPQIVALDVETVSATPLTRDPMAMSFAPRYSPDGEWITFSRESGGNTDIWVMQVDNPSFAKPLTGGPSIDTAPSWSPDGQQIVFESDRSGTSQLYVMRADGSEPTRISFEEGGAYGEPAWSPRGDRIAFTRQGGGGSVIGIMRPDGSGEQILTEGFVDAGPSWAPNGRVLIFTRQSGDQRGPRLHSVDISGRNMRAVAPDDAASDPAWGPLLP
ncbi:MAG: Tol-Pal system beta propeller repeat protein TolB [Paracoccus sp. (in: a-proteobacteria)]